MMGEPSDQSVYCRTPGSVCRSQNDRIKILIQPSRESNCKFVYRRTLGVVCRTQKNISAILKPPTREPAIKKVAKYGMGKRSVELMI
jgi:hypothetical protein